MNCTTCGVLDQFAAVADPLAKHIFTILAAPTARLFNLFINLSVMWLGLMTVLDPGEGVKRFRGLIGKMILLLAVGFALDHVSYVWTFAIDPLRDLAAGFGGLIIEAGAQFAGGSVPPAAGQSVIGQLVSRADAQLSLIIATAFDFLKKLSIMEGGFAAYALNAAILWLLFGLVLLLFAFFLVEAVFYFFAIGALSPLVLAFAPFESTQRYAKAAGSMLVLAALTIIAAALAMGFTVGAIEHFSADFKCSILKSDEACGGPERKDPGATMLTMISVGFISLLLHIKSKTIAANLSGANDSAGPAAIVAGLAKAAGAATLMAGGKLGLQGLKGGAQALQSSKTAGQAAAGAVRRLARKID